MSPDSKSMNVIITGVGGQGNVLAARLLASAALAEGYEVTVGDVYGLTQRGGSVASHVRLTRGNPLPPLVPQNSLDILVAFEPLEALRILAHYQNEDTVAIVNDTPVLPIGVQAGRLAYPALPDLWDALRKLTKGLQLVQATHLAKRLGDVQILNMVMLGALFGSGFLRLRSDVFEKAMESSIPQRHVAMNLTAFREGIDLMKK